MKTARWRLYLNDLARGRLLYRAIRRWSADRRAVFTAIYKARYWNPDGSGESASGLGSTLAATAKARAAIEQIVRDLGVRSMLDAPCGDFNWMRHTNLEGVSYTGADIVPPLIQRNQREFGSAARKFIMLDIVDQVCEPHDLILCRDCIQHLPNADALRIIRNFSKSGSKWLLITMSPRLESNVDMPKAGGFRGVNLFLPPFSLPKPDRTFVEVVGDDPNLEKTLGLWRLPIEVGGKSGDLEMKPDVVVRGARPGVTSG